MQSDKQKLCSLAGLEKPMRFTKAHYEDNTWVYRLFKRHGNINYMSEFWVFDDELHEDRKSVAEKLRYARQDLRNAISG